MNILWFSLSRERQEQIIRQTAQRTGNLPIVIEKDIWVCIVLNVLFESELKDAILFKGGTSLSKGYNIINRFSEDIDIAVDKTYLGFNEPLSKTQIDKLREKVYSFTEKHLSEVLLNGIQGMGLPDETFTIKTEVQKAKKDPVKLFISYQSVIEDGAGYVLPRIIVEVSGRSLNEPKEKIEINTNIFTQFPAIPEANIPTLVTVVVPERTCLEKIFLLHEEFTRDEPRTTRMSRHLFDIHKIIESIGIEKIINSDLFHKIKDHRQIYTPINTTDYESLSMSNISFLPGGTINELFEKDYVEMQEYMFPDGEDTLKYHELLDILAEINSKINNYE